jgi:hypothetical protein
LRCAVAVGLAEFVAVAGLLVAALTLYLNWSQRRSDAADKAATATGPASITGSPTGA